MPSLRCRWSNGRRYQPLKAGVGQIGAGITTAPMLCFVDGLTELAKQRNHQENTITRKPLAIVAFGGNALIDDDAHCSINDQYQTVSNSAKYLVE